MGTSGSSQLSENSICSDEAWFRMRLEFLTSPCSLLFTKILLPQILIALQSISFWIKVYLSLRRIDWINCSSGVMSGLIHIPLGRDLVLDSKRDAPLALLNLIRIGWGRLDCSWYLPSLKWSRIDKGLMLSSALVIIWVILLRLWSNLSCLGVPLLHSSVL